jgi:predicted O-methyltransferase YrrM
MRHKLSFIITKFLRAIKNPIQAFRYFKKNIFLFPKDPESLRVGHWNYGKIPVRPVTSIFPGIENMNITILRAFDRITDTSLDILEIFTLCAITKFSCAKNILEIGTYDGNTALNLAANSPDDSLVTTIDLPLDWNGQFEYKVPTSYLNVTKRDMVGLQFKNTEHVKKIKQVFGDSAKLGWNELPNPFDIIFIDGCHYYEYVKKDTQNAIRYLKSGGLIIWHDYGYLKDVSKVVDETADKIKVEAIQGTRLAVGFTK